MKQQNKNKKIRVGIDARTLKEKGGVRKYVINLINALKNEKDIELIVFYNDKNLLGSFKGCKEVAPFPTPKYLLPIYDLLILPYFGRKLKLDILHLPKSSCNLFKSFKKVVTLHDLIPITRPETEKFFNKIYWHLNFWLSAKFSDLLITDSEYSKKAIINKYNIDHKKIHVVYLGVDKKNSKVKKTNINKIKRKYCLQNRYLLFVGTIQPRKNLIKCIEAVSMFNKNRSNKIDLVAAGRMGWKIKAELLDKEFVKILGFVPEEDLPFLYQGAEALIYVSLEEGFGLPILEAQSFKCPVITSNVSSMPEIAGKGAILTNPHSSSEIAQSITKLLCDKKLKKNLITEGQKNVKLFSWEKCAKETLEVYRKVYDEK